MKKLQNDLFLRACRKEETERTPIWIMRQAGRYLPEYRAVRANSDFLTMCKTPELAAEVTIQPVDLIGVDAAILFSDILVIPEAMGMHLELEEGRGPVFPEPIRDEAGAAKLKTIDPDVDLKYVMDAVKLTLERLDGRVPLIGFCGAPWTLLTYMVEGKGTKTFSVVKKFIYTNPKLAHALLDKIADACAAYLSAKIAAGVHAVQIFDTWGGILSPRDFEEFSLPYITKIVENVKRKKEPVIVFPKGAHASVKQIAKCGADVIGIDWQVNIGKVREKVGKHVAIQGNLDPTILYAPVEKIREEAVAVLKAYGNHPGHIFNLGHGILPDVEPAKARALVEIVHEESAKMRSKKAKKDRHD